ncbi:MAG: helix-turn-helix domain-containing protein [Curvibacter sp.]|nr:helix-turn-helix domain-containing protein [Curvibacter sp.]
MLRTLMATAGHPVSRRRVIEGLGEDFLEYDQRRLDSQLRRLRQKVRREAGRELPINTIHSRGYVFAALGALSGE